MAFSNQRARELMYAWHSGQWSLTYAAASSGLVADVEALQQELRTCATIGATATEKRQLEAIANLLPLRLGMPGRAWDGCVYRPLPWYAGKPLEPLEGEAERLRIMRQLDVTAALAIVPTGPVGEPMTPEGMLAALHKARYHCPQLEPELRLESLRWLRAGGWKDLGGGELPATDELPE